MPFATFPKGMRAKLGIALISVVAVAVVSSSGLLSPITKLLGRAFGAIKFGVMRALGFDRRKQA